MDNFSLVPLYNAKVKIVGIVIMVLAIILKFIELELFIFHKEFSNTILLFAIVIVIFSKEKNENELIRKCRYSALKLSTLVFFVIAISVNVINYISETLGNFDVFTIAVVMAISYFCVFYLLVFLQKDMIANESVKQNAKENKNVMYAIVIIAICVLYMF